MKMIKKLFSAFLILALAFSYTGIGFAAEGDSDFTNVVASGDVTVGDDLTVTDAVAAARVTVTGTTPGTNNITVTTGVSNQYTKIKAQYTELYVYTASTKPASGAKAGTVVTVSNANNYGDCGTAGGGSTFVVCVSDGTNWKTLRSNA
jgi:hypothetical protein